jgi:hypothetical protein
MEYLKIAGLPLEASRIALGTWAIGGCTRFDVQTFFCGVGFGQLVARVNLYYDFGMGD